MTGHSLTCEISWSSKHSRVGGWKRNLGRALCMFLCVAPALGLQNAASAASWRDETWVVTDFSDAVGGGPEGGPAAQAGGSGDAICGDLSGQLFLVDGQFIDIVNRDGMRSHLAGTGELGFRDGPAYQAQFRLGVGAYYHARNIACGPNGVFVPDSGNGRIRRIHRVDGGWRVDTWAGGGDVRIGPGQSARPRAVTLDGTLAVAVTGDGAVTVADNYGAYRIDPEGRRITHLGYWPDSMRVRPDKPARLNVMMGDADAVGNVYFVSRTPDFVVRVDPAGDLIHLAGRVRDRQSLNAGDGPPRQAYFNTPTSLAVQPDGSAVYVCGGDEYDIRRIPANGVGTTATLMQNGRWYVARVHPNRSRGPAEVKPGVNGRLRPDGQLTDLMVNHLLGRDAAGNLYGKLHSWVGITQFVKGHGLLGTRIFRLHRLKSGE